MKWEGISWRDGTKLQYILMKEKRVMLLKSLISMGTDTSLEDKGQTHISGKARHKRHTPHTLPFSWGHSTEGNRELRDFFFLTWEES